MSNPTNPQKLLAEKKKKKKSYTASLGAHSFLRANQDHLPPTLPPFRKVDLYLQGVRFSYPLQPGLACTVSLVRAYTKLDLHCEITDCTSLLLPCIRLADFLKKKKRLPQNILGE